MALNLAPFGRWTLRDKAAQRRLALRYKAPVSHVASLSVSRSEHRAWFAISARPAVLCYGQLGFLAYFFVGFGLLLACSAFPVCQQRSQLQAVRLPHHFPGKTF